MCDPTGMLFLRGAALILSVSSKIQEQRNVRATAIRRNEIADQARRTKEAAENLRIRQIAEKKADKAYDVSIQSKEAQARARAAAENVGGAALDRVVNNYLRSEGGYRSQIERNLEAEIAQSNQNKKLFAIEQEGRQVYIPEVDTVGVFAAGAIEFGGDYMEWQAKKMEKEAEVKRNKALFKRLGVEYG
jgi:hypothetical protein